MNCPYEGCGYESSEAGVKIHHVRTHGESIAFTEVECQDCGNIFQRRHCHEKISDGGYCDDCDYMNGSNNPRWAGGESEYNGDFRPKKKKALERADYTCEKPGCDEDIESLGQSPDVHHIIPARLTEDPKTHKMDNLLVLCREHHREVEPADKTKVPLN